jgi:hypothetical protein
VGGPADDAIDAVREYAAKRDRPRDVDDADAEPMNGTGLTVLDYVRRHRGTA